MVPVSLQSAAAPRAHQPFLQNLELASAFHPWELAGAVPEVMPLQVGPPLARPLLQPGCCDAAQQESLPESAAELYRPMHAALWQQLLQQLSQRLSQRQLAQPVAGPQQATSPLGEHMPWLSQGMWRG